MSKIVSMEEALSHIKDGMTVMIGGFLGCGSPHRIIGELVKNGVKDLTLISNDTAFPDKGIGQMIVKKQFKKIIVSHIGTNRETGRQMNEGELEVVLVPQGTLAEQIRAGGAGFGGFYTPTGVGTIVEEGKEKKTFNGRDYILELPLRADVALIAGAKADEFGNVVYDSTALNFNHVIATAADTVILEVEEVVKVGDIDPHHVKTPGIFVDYIVNGGAK